MARCAVNLKSQKIKMTTEDHDRNKVTTIKCHGDLVSDTAGEIKELVSLLILLGGRIRIDLG
jgi:hypothetical protein